ncbi:MAG: RHS repeat-associated core domain-containing protein, partial [Leifsonia sp.]
RTAWSRTGASDGNFTQQATYNDADQLTRTDTSAAARGVAAGIATYSYDGAGNRVNQSIGGVSTQYGYNPAGQTTQVSRECRTTDYNYDGLGRRVTTTDSTGYGTDTTHTVFNGLAPAQTTSTGAGTATLVRDALGNLAEHVSANGDATWDLLDRLGSTVAGANGSSITQLSTYDDWGSQQLATPGWSAPENYTGETTDPTQGLNHYYARAFDPSAAGWTSSDPWRGLLTEPRTQNRYAYVEDNPASDSDLLGFKAKQQRMPKVCGVIFSFDCLFGPIRPGPAPAPPSNPPATNPKPAQLAPTTPAPPAKPKATGPNSQTKVQATHEDGWTPCDKYCQEAWKKFYPFFWDAVAVAPEAAACIASLPLGGPGCVHLNPESWASLYVDELAWWESEQQAWEHWLANW